MVFYFSGTGNSLWTAKEISNTFDEPLISIADELKNDNNHFNYTLKKVEKIFFVFPVHSWGPAVLVYRFIHKLTFSHYTQQPVYVVCTCGDNCGQTDKVIRKLLSEKSIDLTGAYSIQMPNNYILMKGFGIDPKEVEKEKLAKAPDLLGGVIKDIRNKENKKLYVTGGAPFIKTRIVYPLFQKFSIKNNSFFATDECISCGLCEEICPTDTIKLIDGKPTWDNTCVQCTACIHRCPARAIEYGKITQNQGRYVHPDLA